jgi:outer membrane protein assembly factor BamB
MLLQYRGGVMCEVDPSGKIVKEYLDPLAHHDQNHLDDGTLLYTTLEPLTPEQSATVVGGIPGSEAPGGKIYGDCIKHVEPSTREVLWKWRLIDHIDPKVFPLDPHYAREHFPLINSVAFLRDGNILASFRSVSAVVIISRTTGEIIWHLDSKVVAQQHCASEMEDGSILIFDNGAYRRHDSAVYSRAIQVSRESKKIIWEYRDKSFPMAFFTPFMGAAQRLKNGNTFITEAAFGRMFEVTLEGEMVWEYINPNLASYKGLGAEELENIGFDFEANAVFRAYKYSPEEIPWLSLPSPAASP